MDSCTSTFTTPGGDLLHCIGGERHGPGHAQFDRHRKFWKWDCEGPNNDFLPPMYTGQREDRTEFDAFNHSLWLEKGGGRSPAHAAAEFLKALEV
jgi:hypothetical protein